MTFPALAFPRRMAALGPLFVLATAAPAQDAEQMAKVYDLRGLLRESAALRDEGGEPMPTMPSGWVIPGRRSGGFTKADPHATFGHSAVVYGNHRRSLRPDDLELQLRGIAGEDAWSEYVDGVFRVQASPAAHDRIRDRLSTLRALLRDRIRVRVHALTEAGDGALVDAAGVAEMVAEGRTEVLLDRSVLADVPRFLASGRFLSFVRDFDIEVAQDSKIGDPKVDVIFDGLRLGVDISPMVDGRHYVRLGLQRADVTEPMRTHALGVDYLGNVQLPEVRVDEVLVAVAVEDGGGVVVGGSDAAWLVTFAREGQRVPSAEAVPVAPLGVVDLPRGASRIVISIPGEDSGMLGLDLTHSEDPLPRLDLVLGGALAASESHVERVASSLLIVDERLREQVVGVLRKHCEQVRARSVDLAWGSVDRGVLGAPMASGEWGAVAEALPQRWSMPTVAGQWFSAAVGQERQYVGDYEAEISADASACNPVMRRTFSGLGVRGSIALDFDGALLLELEARWSAARDPERFDLDVDDIGRMQTLDVGYTELDLDGTVTPGHWHLVGTVPDPRDGARQNVLLTRVR